MNAATPLTAHQKIGLQATGQSEALLRVLLTAAHSTDAQELANLVQALAPRLLQLNSVAMSAHDPEDCDTVQSMREELHSGYQHLVLGSDASSWRTAGDSVSGRVALTISCSASVIRPRPMTMRPKWPTDVVSRLMNSTTPTKISSGDSHDRSKENTTTIALVPMSAPSITASAAAVPMSPRPTKDATISPVAVLDCTSVVTATPASSACRRLPTLREMT